MGGRSSPIVLRGKLYTIVRDQPETANEGEKVVCADAATGEILWEHRFNMYLSDVPDTRIGWSCCAGDPETGRIYVQGVCGYFCCLEGDTGQTGMGSQPARRVRPHFHLRRPDQCAARV